MFSLRILSDSLLSSLRLALYPPLLSADAVIPGAISARLRVEVLGSPCQQRAARCHFVPRGGAQHKTVKEPGANKKSMPNVGFLLTKTSEI